jgi:hypothetical protein
MINFYPLLKVHVMQYKSIFQGLILVLLAVLISACNDNSNNFNGRSSDKATITANNAQAITVGVTDGVGAAYSYQELNEIITHLRTTIENRDINSASIAGTCAANAGTMAFPSGLVQTGTITGTLTFNQFCLAGGTLTGDVVLEGDADFEITYDQNALITKLSLDVTNVTINDTGYVINLNGSLIQEGSQLSTVTLTMDYIGSDGRQYQAINLDKTGTYSNGYSIGGGSVISDPSYGTVDIKTKTPIFYDASCSSGKPISGTMLVTGDSSDELEIYYDNCTAYTICINNNCDPQSSW